MSTHDLADLLSVAGLLLSVVGSWVMFTSKLDGIDCGNVSCDKITIFQGSRAKLGLTCIAAGTGGQILAVLLGH